MQITLFEKISDNTAFIEELMYLLRFEKEIEGNRILCINPRQGELPLAFLQRRNDLKFDAFVSDDEWQDAAKNFSENVYFGYSHSPLAAVTAGSYDAVLICEDMSLVDDEDKMFQEYYRLLKQGGVILGGIWNISYHRYLMNLLLEVSLPKERISDPVHGSCTFPIGTLIQRFKGLGFLESKVFSLYSEHEDVSKFIEISGGNTCSSADEALFMTKTFLVKAVK